MTQDNYQWYLFFEKWYFRIYVAVIGRYGYHAYEDSKRRYNDIYKVVQYVLCIVLLNALSVSFYSYFRNTRRMVSKLVFKKQLLSVQQLERR